MNDTQSEPTAIEVKGGTIQRGDDMDLLAMLEQRNKLLEKVLEYAIKSTRPDQWTDLQGNPWPTAPACESMARRCGVAISNVRREKQQSSDDMGPFYLYVVTGVGKLPSGFDEVEAIGVCTSRDQFLGTETTHGRELSEVDEGHIMQAAYSNMIVNVVTRLLGVRRITWARLEELGILRDGSAKVEYKTGSRGGGKQAIEDEPMKFGPAKGKSFSQMEPKELESYRQIFVKELADPEKAKFHDNTKRKLAALEAVAAKAKNGTAPPAGFWPRIKAMAEAAGVPAGIIGETVKAATGKGNAKDLTEDDVAKFAKHLEGLKASNEDIPF